MEELKQSAISDQSPAFPNNRNMESVSPGNSYHMQRLTGGPTEFIRNWVELRLMG